MAFTEMALLGLGLGLSALGTSASIGASIYNTKSQEAARVDNEKLMREAWARDDKARQRMVTDLENAGLSKWLASGATPMSSSPVSLNAPQFDSGAFDALEHSFNNALSFMQTKSQNKLADKQGALADASKAVQDAEEKIKNEELKIKQQELRIKRHDADVWTNRPSVASNDPATLRYLVEGGNLVSGNSDAGNEFADWLKGMLTGNYTITESPKPVPETPKPATSKQQQKIQKLKGKDHDFFTYQDWYDSLSDYTKKWADAQPAKAYKEYQKVLKSRNK